MYVYDTCMYIVAVAILVATLLIKVEYPRNMHLLVETIFVI